MISSCSGQTQWSKCWSVCQSRHCLVSIVHSLVPLLTSISSPLCIPAISYGFLVSCYMFMFVLYMNVQPCREWYGGSGPLPVRCAAAQEVVRSFTVLANSIILQWSHKEPSDLHGSLLHHLLKTIEESRLPSSLLVPNLFFLIAAGQETTCALISSCLLAVVERPRVRDAIVTGGTDHLNSRLIQSLVQETMRVYGPIRRYWCCVMGLGCAVVLEINFGIQKLLCCGYCGNCVCEKDKRWHKCGTQVT